MEIFHYLLVIFVLLEWTFSNSFQIIKNIPGENEIQSDLIKKMRRKNEVKEKPMLKLSDSLKSIGNNPKLIKLCELQRYKMIHFCKLVLGDKEFDIHEFNEPFIGECQKKKIDLGQPAQEIFTRSMLTCYPLSWDKRLYSLTSTGDRIEPSLYLFIRPESQDGLSRPPPKLVAKIVFTGGEMEEVRTLQDNLTSKFTRELGPKQGELGTSSSTQWPTVNFNTPDK